MERQDYFAIVDYLSFDTEEAVVRLKDLTADEAKSVCKALASEFGFEWCNDQQMNVPSGIEISLMSETDALKDSSKYLIFARQARSTEYTIQTSSSNFLVEHRNYRIAIAAIEHAKELKELQTRNAKEPSFPETDRFEAFDKDTRELVIFDARNLESWGPTYYQEDYDLDGMPVYSVQARLYRHRSGHWTLLSERTHVEAPCSCGMDLERLEENKALAWLARNGFDIPAELESTALASVKYFKPGLPPPALSNGTASTSPVWNKDRGELSFSGRVIRRVARGRATNIVKVLDAFQEENWPDRIDDPLAPSKDQQRLHETIASLNENQDPPMIRSRGDGTGQGIVWELIPQEPPRGADDIPF